MVGVFSWRRVTRRRLFFPAAKFLFERRFPALLGAAVVGARLPKPQRRTGWARR
jgi:hypothetical protein